MVDPSEKRAELAGMAADELAREALVCRRLMRQAADDIWTAKWWDLIRAECDRRGKPETAVLADEIEVAEHRAARSGNWRACRETIP